MTVDRNWTSPAPGGTLDLTTGNKVFENIWDALISNLGHIGGTSGCIGAHAYHNAAQSINTASETTLALNSERWDTDSIHDTAVNNSRLTCVTPGK